MVEIIYVAASAHDARYTRICIASIRYFYPDIPIQLLVGGPLESGLAEELERYWNVGLADLPRGDWGWGFIKLEPLFGPIGESFLVLDSDTVFTGRVLELWESCSADFLVDNEQQNEVDTCRLYYDWRKVAGFDHAAHPPGFVFNSGQWFGKGGILSRSHFSKWVDWNQMPPKLRLPELFMPGEQGILNYVLNQGAASGEIEVKRTKLLHWPGHGMEDLTAEKIAAGQAQPQVIHWAGLKRPRLSSIAGKDILRFFEAYYYTRIPRGSHEKLLRQLRYPFSAYMSLFRTRIRLKLAPYFKAT